MYLYIGLGLGYQGRPCPHLNRGKGHFTVCIDDDHQEVIYQREAVSFHEHTWVLEIHSLWPGKQQRFYLNNDNIKYQQ